MDFGRYVTDAVESAYMWGLVQRFLRDSGFNAAPVHVAILDKGQRSAKGLNSGSEGLPGLPEDQSGDGETEGKPRNALYTEQFPLTDLVDLACPRLVVQRLS